MNVLIRNLYRQFYSPWFEMFFILVKLFEIIKINNTYVGLIFFL